MKRISWEQNEYTDAQMLSIPIHVLNVIVSVKGKWQTYRRADDEGEGNDEQKIKKKRMKERQQERQKRGRERERAKEQ